MPVFMLVLLQDTGAGQMPAATGDSAQAWLKHVFPFHSATLLPLCQRDDPQSLTGLIPDAVFSCWTSYLSSWMKCLKMILKFHEIFQTHRVHLMLIFSWNDSHVVSFNLLKFVVSPKISLKMYTSDWSFINTLSKKWFHSGKNDLNFHLIHIYCVSVLL